MVHIFSVQLKNGDLAVNRILVILQRTLYSDLIILVLPVSGVQFLQNEVFLFDIPDSWVA